MAQSKDVTSNTPEERPASGKLKLNKETLKDLDAGEPDAVRGGVRVETPTCTVGCTWGCQ